MKTSEWTWTLVESEVSRQQEQKEIFDFWPRPSHGQKLARTYPLIPLGCCFSHTHVCYGTTRQNVSSDVSSMLESEHLADVKSFPPGKKKRENVSVWIHTSMWHLIVRISEATIKLWGISGHYSLSMVTWCRCVFLSLSTLCWRAHDKQTNLNLTLPKVFWSQDEELSAEGCSRRVMAAPLLCQRKRRGRPDLWNQCGDHAAAAGWDGRS